MTQQISKIFTVVFLWMILLTISSCQGAKPADNLLQRDAEGLVPFEMGLESSQPVIVKIGLDNCVGCEIANEVFKALSPQYPQVYFSKIDILKDRSAIQEYGITQLPTIIFFDAQGNKVYRIEDIIDEDMMINKMKELEFIR